MAAVSLLVSVHTSWRYFGEIIGIPTGANDVKVTRQASNRIDAAHVEAAPMQPPHTETARSEAGV